MAVEFYKIDLSLRLDDQRVMGCYYHDSFDPDILKSTVANPEAPLDLRINSARRLVVARVISEDEHKQFIARINKP